VVFAMASTSNDMLKNYTWYLIDQVVTIFLAVMYFQAFDSLLDFAAMGFHNGLVSSLAHALVVLAVTLLLAYYLRKSGIALAILCGAGAHVVSFSSIHAAANLQNLWVSMSYSWWMALFGMAVLILGCGIIAFLARTAKSKAEVLENDTFMEKTEDLENDVGAMTFSVVFTMFMRFLLTGHHPTDENTTGFNHTAEERLAMLIYAGACLVVAMFAVRYCAQASDASYTKRRILSFCSTVALMNVAWAALFWGEWEFYGNLYAGEAVKGRVMFAILATLLCGLGLYGLTKLPSEGAKSIGIKSEKLVALTALSLVCAWSWELCFDGAMEAMAEGSAHPVGYKVATTIVLGAVVLPVYVMFMKPITGPAAAAIA